MFFIPEIEILTSFLITSLLLGLAPGPDNIFILTQSLAYGRKAGFTITLGLCSGLVIHSFAVAMGVAAIFQTSQFAFQLLKYFGVAYLAFLAFQVFRNSPETIFSKKPAKLFFLFIEKGSL